MLKLPPTPPFSHRLVVGTLAVFAGIWAFWDAGKDFEFVKFEPHTPEEIERRRREKVGLSIKHLDTRTLDYTPEAKERMHKLIQEQQSRTSEER